MGSRFFRFKLMLHVGFLLLTVTVLAYTIVNTEFFATMLVLAGILVVQVLELMRHVDRTNRDVSYFLSAVRHSDFALSFTGSRADDGSFGELAAAFDDVLDRFRTARSQREAQAQYLDALMQHIPVAVIALCDDGRITQFNRAAARLVGRGDVRDLTLLESTVPELAHAISDLAAGEQRLVKAVRDAELLQLNVHAAVVRMSGHEEKLVTVQNIRAELEASELTAWQNLIRVLTHEIMNSLTPITSLAATARDTLDETVVRTGAAPEAQREIEEARDAVDTIARRGGGLMRFVQSYRELARMPRPRVRVFTLDGLVERVGRLMAEDTAQRGIELTARVHPPALEVSADPELMEQALINLIRNAADAVQEVETPVIVLEGRLADRNRVVISVADNGAGMTDETKANLFVPFFTTKRDGSGIGMSLVRQVMRLHNGGVTVDSRPGGGTTVTLKL